MTENIQTRLWSWYRTSPVSEFIWWLILMWLCIVQHGWHRWIFFSVGVMAFMSFLKKADKEWLRR